MFCIYIHSHKLPALYFSDSKIKNDIYLLAFRHISWYNKNIESESLQDKHGSGCNGFLYQFALSAFMHIEKAVAPKNIGDFMKKLHRKINKALVFTAALVLLSVFILAVPIHALDLEESGTVASEQEPVSSMPDDSSSDDPSGNEESSEDSSSSAAEEEEQPVTEPDQNEEPNDEPDEEEPIAIIKPAGNREISVLTAFHTVSNFTQLQTAIQDADTDIEITFVGNVAFTSTIAIPASKTVTIKGTGQTLSLDPSMSFIRHFEVSGTLILESGITLNGAISGQAAGGGIYVSGGGTLLLSGAVIDQCKAAYGGAVQSYSANTVVMSGGIIQNCIAENGGGLYISSSGNNGFRMEGESVIQNCIARGSVTAEGGGVCLDTGKFFMTGNSKILSCRAGVFGGGVFAQKPGTFIQLGDGTPSSTPQISGCIAEYKLDFNLDAPNAKYGQGGGIYAENTSIFIYPNVTMTDNHASNNGGGLYLAETASLAMNGGSITNSTASNGGGIFLVDTSQFTISTGVISGCNALYQGGGIAVNGASVTIEAGTLIQSCSAGIDTVDTYWSGKGGGIYLYPQGHLTMNTGSVIDQCVSKTLLEQDPQYNQVRGSGGGIYVESGASANLSGVSITNCTAYRHGGGIFTKSYANVTTDSTVQFSGNRAAFYRIPADTVLSGSYPCKNASTISPDASLLNGREYPLNNWDINHMSYLIAYYGNTGEDPALTPQTEYKIQVEYSPFETAESTNDMAVHTVYANNRSENGDLFEFKKDGAVFGMFSNYDRYVPHEEWFNKYGTTPAPDDYPYGNNPNNPDQPYTLTTRSVYNMYTTDGLPEMNFYALWLKDVTISKKVNGLYANLTQDFTIHREFLSAYGQTLPLPISDTLILKHEDSETITIYDDVRLIIEEDSLSASGYSTVYRDNSGTSASPINKVLNEYSDAAISITVENTWEVAVPSGIDTDSNGGHTALLVGLLGIALCFLLFRYNSIVRYRRKNTRMR